ncbi:MAG: DUF1456 family protein [Pseudomonadales bacterium]|nr:DUF1456 family protein [Pseudomonadales bacterium]
MNTNDEYKALIREKGLMENDVKAIFSLAGVEMSKSQVKAFALGDHNRRYKIMPDKLLSLFKEGLVKENKV